jgi:cardiolipin synthase
MVPAEPAARRRFRWLDGRHLFPAVLYPRLGRRLPRELYPHRVGRLAAALPEGLADPGFADLLQRIDGGAPLWNGNRVEIYTKGEAAFAAMLESIRGARREVLIESYIFKDDDTGRHFFNELAAAVERGVTVRLLADAVGSSSTKAEFWCKMRERKIDCRLFHPLLPYLWAQAYRDHRKILVVDREVGFTGGMNIGEEYGSFRASLPRFLRGRKPAPAPPPKDGNAPLPTWRDTHLRVTGPVAWELAVVFAEGWKRAEGTPFELPPLEVPAKPPPGARALVLDSQPRRGHMEVASALAAIAAAARSRIWLTNAYFAPGHLAVRLLARAVKRGVDVRLLLPGKSDVALIQHAAHGYYTALLKRGVRIFEYQPSILHAKTLVADGLISVVGSSNLDFRSFVFNAECNLVMLDRGTAHTLETAFERDLEQSKEITLADWKNRTFWHHMGDRAARWLSPVL